MVKKRYLLPFITVFHGLILSLIFGFWFTPHKVQGIQVSFECKKIFPTQISQLKIKVADLPKARVTPEIDAASLENTGLSTDLNSSHNIPKCVTRVAPIYPEFARQKGIQADFQVELTIDYQGNVCAVNIAAHEYMHLFKQAIEQALYAWKFEVGSSKRDFVVPVEFKLI